MFEVKAVQLGQAVKAFHGKTKSLGNKHYLMLMALAGVLEHAHAAVKQEPDAASQADDANQALQAATANPPITVAVENAETQEALQQALAELAEMEPALQELIDGQIKLVLVDPVTGKPCVGEEACIYAIGEDGGLIQYESGMNQVLFEQGKPIHYAQAETGVASDAVASGGVEAGTATASVAAAGATGISLPMMAALGVLGVAAASGGGSSGSVAPANNAPTAVTLSASTVAENAAGTTIGNLTVTDPDAGDTHTYSVDDARFEVVAGQLRLKAGVSLDHEAATTVNVTVTATDAGGLSKAQAFAITVTDVAETTTLIGTAGADSIDFPAGLDDFIITGLAGNDILNTGVGNDIVRPGEGADSVNTGTGNDIVVVVGQTAAGQYVQSDISNPGGSGIDLTSVITLADLNGRAVSEVVAGESIDGGAGTNRLVIYGNVDFTGVTLTNITQFQVNSTVTISAQQLNALGLSVIFGDGESVLNISNDGGAPITVDLSGMTFADFRTLNLGAGVTLIVDQTDVASLHYLTGEGTLQASIATGTLNLADKYLTLAIQDKDGNIDATHGGGSHIAGELLIGSESADTLTGGTDADRLEGGAGHDTLIGGDGNDILRGGAGVDSMDGGAGDDRFVIVGDISGGGKVDSVADTAALGFPLTDLNGQNLNEDEDGAVEIIRGGDGDDTLYVYGTADLSNFEITGIEHIEIRSHVTFSEALLTGNALKSLTGDGSSIIRIDGGTAGNPLIVDLSAVDALKLGQIGQISLGEHVVLKIASLGQLGGARIFTGNGTIEATSGSITLPSSYTTQSTLTVKNADGSSARGSAEVLEKVVIGNKDVPIIGSDGDDYLIGTDFGDKFDGKNGNDVFSGKKGNDTFIISGSGKKIILDSAENTDIDTLDLSKATGSAVVNLKDGGTVGAGTTIQLGSGSATGATQQDAPDINLMLIFDVSGSMGIETSTGTRMSDAKNAAIALIDAYDNVGDIAVRIITFQSSATSTFHGFNGWIDVATAKSIVNGLSDGGGTNYVAAVNTATQAYGIGKGTTYFDNGADVSYFLSDGEPSPGIDSTGETNWESFLIQNQITSHAIGFGGLSSTNALEPIAYDGTKVKPASDDHAPGEIQASITVNTNNLGADLIAAAKLDFIENLVGTGQADSLTGNSLDNRIEGGSGVDTLMGSGGNDTLIGGIGQDVAVYAGSPQDYLVEKIMGLNGSYKISDALPGRDGVDVVHDIEQVTFLSGTATNASDDKTFTPEELANGTYDYGPAWNTEQMLEEYGYRLFFNLTLASYNHNIPGLESKLGSTSDSFNSTPYDNIKNNTDWAQGLELWEGTNTFTEHITTTISGDGNIGHSFIDGIYYAEQLNPSTYASNAVALVTESNDSLFITFRGSDALTDWLDDAIKMQSHYKLYAPLFEAVDSYLKNNDAISKVYISGHSLGGQMAMQYMKDHDDGWIGTKNNRAAADIEYQAVTFEAANKLNLSTGDARFTNFEMRHDIVADIPFARNYGNSIYLEYDGADLAIFGHLTGTIDSNGVFDSVNQYLMDSDLLTYTKNKADPIEDIRVYYDDGDGVIETMNSGVFDTYEYVQTGYDFHTVFPATSPNTGYSVVINQPVAIGSNNTYTASNEVSNVILAKDYSNLISTKTQAGALLGELSGIMPGVIVGQLISPVINGVNAVHDYLNSLLNIPSVSILQNGLITFTGTAGGVVVGLPLAAAGLIGGLSAGATNAVLSSLVDFDINITGGHNSRFATGNQGNNVIDISHSTALELGFVAGGFGSDIIFGSNHNSVLIGDDYSRNFYNVTASAKYSIPQFTSYIPQDLVINIESSTRTDLLDLIDLKPISHLFESFKDTILGGAGHDILAGGYGADTMAGATGDDLYFIEGKGDVVIEKPNEGHDTIIIYPRFTFDQIKDVTTPNNIEVIIVADDAYTPSENININSSATTNDVVLIGNAGNNRLVGGSANDLIVGGADKDILLGGNGSDFLFGSTLDASIKDGKDLSLLTGFSQSEIDELLVMANQYSPFTTRKADSTSDPVDSDIYWGGLGRDIMFGSHSDKHYGYDTLGFDDNDGNTDFFLIDIEATYNTSTRSDEVDVVKNFYVSGSDIGAEDYLVFSINQLGFDANDMTAIGKFAKPFFETLNKQVWQLPDFGSNDDDEEHFFVVDGIQNYVHTNNTYLLDEDYEGLDDKNDDLFAFILDSSTGFLYFDQDGNMDFGDQILIADLDRHPNGDVFMDMHADQILLLADFDLV